MQPYHILHVVLPVSVDSGYLGCALQDVRPLGSLVPVQLAAAYQMLKGTVTDGRRRARGSPNSTLLKTHIDASDVRRDRHHFEVLLTCPSARL